MTSRDTREKHWKHLYLRSQKLARAQELGIDDPREPKTQLRDPHSHNRAHDEEPLNVLFVCSRNQWRSPTAENVWRSHPGLRVRSAGTSPHARRHVCADDLRWADTVFVMEDKHRSRLQAEFGRLLAHTPVHVLDIPDEYRYMDPELVEWLKDSVGAILGLP